MIENIEQAIKGIFSHKMRSFLTMVGVIIGIAAIIAIVSIVEGTSKKLEKSLVGSGNNVTILAPSEDGSYAYDMSNGIPNGFVGINDKSQVIFHTHINGIFQCHNLKFIRIIIM